MRHTATGAGVCELRVATNESWTDKSGERQERTEWHRVVVWGSLAETCSKHLSKGRQVYVEGSIKTRTWEDSDSVKRYTTEIIARTVQFLGSRRDLGSKPAGEEEGPDYGYAPY